LISLTRMPHTLDPELRRALAERIRYCHEMGVYDFYRRGPQGSPSTAIDSVGTTVDDLPATSTFQTEPREEMAAKKSAAVAKIADENTFTVLIPHAEQGVSDPVAALKLIREDLGDCTRCKLHKQGRKQIVFGVGSPQADLMFVGEGPGADEDAQGEPFVGRAGQLLNNMIKAMGIRRDDVYIANVVKCRPPGNRQPEPDEVASCSPFLFRQLDSIKPKVIVCLGATAFQTLLQTNRSISHYRGQWLDYRGYKMLPTYHPAYLLRNPAAKADVWKDLQKVMAELGLEIKKKAK